MRDACAIAHDAPMIAAVIWSEDRGPAFAGRLELVDSEATLWGRDRSGVEWSACFDCADLVDVRVERLGAVRLTTGPTLVLEHRAGRRYDIGSINGVGVLGELAEQFAVHPKLLTA